MDHPEDIDSILNEAYTLYNDAMDAEFEEIKQKTLDKLTGIWNTSSKSKSPLTSHLVDLQKELEKLHQKIKSKIIETIAAKYSLNTTKQSNNGNESIEIEKLESGLKFQLEKYTDLLKLLVNSTIRPVIGIDLGTTFCCVAVYHEGKVSIVRNSLGQYTTPSYIAFSKNWQGDNNNNDDNDDDDDYLTIGQQAKDEANINPENTIFDAKRLIGRKFKDKIVQEDIKLWPFHVQPDENQNPKIRINSVTCYPEEISAKLLKCLKKEAEDFIGEIQITDAVITVPAYFNNGQRQATKDAGKLAGLNVLQILNEPTAAAITYSLHRIQPSKKNVLIFDLGGGTFDVSVLTVEGGTIKILAVGGDTHLGGEDFDNILVNYCIQEFRRRTGVDLAEGKDSEHLPTHFKVNKRLRRLRNECEKQKIFLSSSRKVKVALDTIDGSRDLIVEFTRDRFEDLIQSKLDQCIKTVDEVINEIPNFKKQDIQDIVLVGGSTHIPKLQQMLRDYFEGRPLSKSINPDEAVAWGATTLACLLSSHQGQGQSHGNNNYNQNGNGYSSLKSPIEIADVTPLSLGIEIHEGDFSPIVPKNTTIPFEVTRRYKTRHDYQSTIKVAIYEGEDKLTKNNHLLGKFILSNIPLARARQEKCYVTMRINCEGILTVEASSVSNTMNQTGIKISMHTDRPKHHFNTVG